MEKWSEHGRYKFTKEHWALAGARGFGGVLSLDRAVEPA